MHYDELLKILGEFGYYQKTRMFLICLVATVCGFHAMNMVFVGAKPDKWCTVPTINLSSYGFTNVSQTQIDHILRAADSEGGCHIYDRNEILPLLTREDSIDVLLASIRVGNVTLKRHECQDWTFSRDVYGPTIVTEFQLVCKSAWLTSMSKTLYFFGRLLGAAGFGQLSDIYGRRPAFFGGLFMLLIVGCAAAVAPNMYVFIPFYIMQGAAQTGLFLIGFTMCTEMVGPSYRVAAGYFMNQFYTFGYMALSGIAYLIYDWRYIEIAITVPVALFAGYLCVLPESTRWLLSKGRKEEAKEIIDKVSTANKVNLTEDMLRNLGEEEEKMMAAQNQRKYTFIDLFRPLPMLVISLNVWFNWLVNSMVYYGLALGTANLGGDPYINFLVMGAVELPADMFVLFLNRLGRKKPLTLSMIFGGLSCVASSFVPKDMVALKVILALGGKFGITISYAVIYLFAAEVFPTVVRNIGMGVSSMSARVGGMLAPQILDLGVFWKPLPFLVFGILSIIAGLLALLLPETTGKPLAQIPDDLTNPEEAKEKNNLSLEQLPNDK